MEVNELPQMTQNTLYNYVKITISLSSIIQFQQNTLKYFNLITVSSYKSIN